MDTSKGCAHHRNVSHPLHGGVVVQNLDSPPRTTSKDSRMKEYLDTANVPDLTEEELQAIDSAGEQFYKRIYVRHVFGE